MALTSSLTRGNITAVSKELARQVCLSFQEKSPKAEEYQDTTPLPPKMGPMPICLGAITLDSRTKPGAHTFLFAPVSSIVQEKPKLRSQLVSSSTPVVGTDQFFNSLWMLDTFRNAFAKQQREFVQARNLFQCFGDVSFLWSLRKSQFKMVFWLLSTIIDDNFAGSVELQQLMFMMYRWLLLLRFIEYIYAVIRNTVQLPPNSPDRAVVSERVAQILKVFMFEVVPKNFTDVESFIRDFRQKLNYLEKVFTELQMVIMFDPKSAESHKYEINKLLDDLECGKTPTWFSTFNRPSEISEIVPTSLSQILSRQGSSSVEETFSAISGILKVEEITQDPTWFYASSSLIKIILTIRTAFLKERTKIMLAEAEKMRAQAEQLRAETAILNAERLLMRARRRLKDEECKEFTRKCDPNLTRNNPRDPRDVQGGSARPYNTRDSHDPRDVQGGSARPSYPRDSHDPRDVHGGSARPYNPRDSHDSRDQRDVHGGSARPYNSRDSRDQRDVHGGSARPYNPRDSRDQRDVHGGSARPYNPRDSRDQRDVHGGSARPYNPRDSRNDRRRSRSPRRN